jgi:hypothetical protein
MQIPTGDSAWHVVQELTRGGRRINLSGRVYSAAQDLVLYQLHVYLLATDDIGYLQ